MNLDGDGPGGRSVLRLLRRFFQPHWTWFAAGTGAAVTTALAAVAYGGIVKFVGDALQVIVGGELAPDSLVAQLGTPSISMIYWLLAAVAIAAAVRGGALYAMTLLNNTGVQRALVDVQDAQFGALTDADLSALERSASGELVSRFINDLNALRDAGLRLANNLTRGVVTIIGAFTGMLLMDWQLTLILLIAYPVAFAPIIALGNRVRKRAKRAQGQIGEVTGLLGEAFRSARVVKAFGLEARQKQRAAQSFRTRSRLYLRVLADKAAVDPILELAGGLAIALVLGVSAWRISQGGASFGDFLGFLTLIGIAAPELRALGTLNAVVQEGGAAADRVFTVLDAPRALRDAPGAKPLAPGAGDIDLQNVGFAYGGGPPVLRGLSLKVQGGETVALVGSSGSGKTTLFSLLLRFHAPTSGRILVDGQDITEVTAESLRRQLAFVPQQPALFDLPIGANIRLGAARATEDAVRAAARAAEADGFIRAMPEGYDTPAGEAGGNLSGGQRQRIALARALVRDAPILLLDEATSALDAESEAKVQAAIEAARQGRTTLIIAHRLSTVRSADRVVVLEEGRVVEQGPPAELLGRGGAFARLNALQLA